jgi:hypothetical protein
MSKYTYDMLKKEYNDLNGADSNLTIEQIDEKLSAASELQLEIDSANADASNPTWKEEHETIGNIVSYWTGQKQKKIDGLDASAPGSDIVKHAYSVQPNLHIGDQMVKNAYANYERSRATYGKQAEALAQNGLANSGYSDYMEGRAYGAYVGEVQHANKVVADTALAAAYEELRMNREADKQYNAEVTAAEKAYNEIYGKALATAGTGAFNGWSIEQIQKSYGLNEKDAYDIYEANKVGYADTTRKKQEETAASIADLNANFMSGTYTEEQYRTEASRLGMDASVIDSKVAERNNIRDASLIASVSKPDDYGEYMRDVDIRALCLQNGITDEAEIQKYIDAKNEAEQGTKAETGFSSITANTTNEQIENLGITDEKLVNDLKAKRDELVLEGVMAGLQEELDNDKATIGDIENVDTMFEQGDLSGEVYHKIYYEKGNLLVHMSRSKKECREVASELERYYEEGKLTASDYDKLADGLTRGKVTSAAQRSFAVNPDSKTDVLKKDCIEVYNGLGGTTKVTYENLKSVDGNSKIILNAWLGHNKKQFALAKYEDRTYIHLRNKAGDWEWMEVTYPDSLALSTLLSQKEQ